MKSDPLIRANILARRGKYEEAIRVLEGEEDRYYGSFSYYYLLGACYLYSRAYGKALTFFKYAREKKMRDPSALLGIAALHLNHGDTGSAVDLYLEILEFDEHNKIAGKALKLIKKNPGPENISAWIEKGRLHTIFPPFPKLPPSKKGFKLLAASVLVIIIGIFVSIRTGIIPFGQSTLRQVPAGIELLREELEAPMQSEGSFRYVLTRDEVNNYYNEARRLFTSFHDENARVNLNRILESNGPEPVKNKARILLSYLETPRFDTLKDRFSYAQVDAEPILYRDCHIIWRGTATNIDIGQYSTAFDLLAGYDTRRTMEGIVRVDCDFATPINPERPVEVLGRIILYNTERGINFRIQGIAINQAGLLD
jgi:tetratricopeptide (TPR) repeat protein